METLTAVTALSALAQETRLGAYRLLVQAGEAGLPAGGIAERLGVPPATLSFHLKELAQAGLVANHTAGRFVIYRTNFDVMHRLIDYLSENCCGSSPAACAPTICKPGKETP